MSTKAKAFVTALGLEDGRTYRGNCPSCKGTNTFTASNQGGSVVYNCYKLGCDATGAFSQGLSAAEIRLRMQKREYDKASEAVEEEAMELPITLSYNTTNPLMQEFVAKWQLQNVPLLYDIAQSRAVFPIVSQKGRLLDAVGRALTGLTPKWLRYSGKGHYYAKGSGTTAIVVEDCISACVAAQRVSGTTGVAILGTQLTKQHVDYLQQFDKVIVALDPDALTKTIAYTRQLKSHNISAVAAKISDDLKYGVVSDMKMLTDLVTTDS